MPCEVVLYRVDFFQDGCRCHGNGQNAKKFKNTKMIIAGYSANRSWWNLIWTTSRSSGTRLAKKNWNRLDKLCRSRHGSKKGGFKKKLDSFHQNSWNFVGISTVVCGNFWWLQKFKMAAVAMVTKVQNMLNSLQTPTIFAVIFPVTSTFSGTR